MIKACMVIGLMGMLLGSFGTPTHATILNGDFSTGLTGWTTEDTDINSIITTPSTSITATGGEAMLVTQGIASGIAVISLLQVLDIPALATNLSFDMDLAHGVPDTPPGGSSVPDFVQASYFDANDPIFDRVFVSLNGNGAVNFTTSIMALAGRSGTLFFDLSDQDDGFFSTARVDNVRIDVGTTAVPEPGTWLLVGSGLLGLGALAGKRGRASMRYGGAYSPTDQGMLCSASLWRRALPCGRLERYRQHQ